MSLVRLGEPGEVRPEGVTGGMTDELIMRSLICREKEFREVIRREVLWELSDGSPEGFVCPVGTEEVGISVARIKEKRERKSMKGGGGMREQRVREQVKVESGRWKVESPPTLVSRNGGIATEGQAESKRVEVKKSVLRKQPD